MAQPRPKSRQARWTEAVEAAREANEALADKRDETQQQLQVMLDDLNALIQPVLDAVQEIRDIQGEYQDWYDNLPDSLRDNSPVSEKLSGVIDLYLDADLEEIEIPDLEFDTEAIDQLLDEAEAADLPLGFGRD